MKIEVKKTILLNEVNWSDIHNKDNFGCWFQPVGYPTYRITPIPADQGVRMMAINITNSFFSLIHIENSWKELKFKQTDETFTIKTL